jgi:hypothetical protein
VSKDKESPSTLSSITHSGTATASMTADRGRYLALGDATDKIDMVDGGDNTAAVYDPPHEMMFSAGLVSHLVSE